MHRVAHVFCGQPAAFCVDVSSRSPRCWRFVEFFCVQRLGAFLRKILTGFSTFSVGNFSSFLPETDRHDSGPVLPGMAVFKPCPIETGERLSKYQHVRMRNAVRFERSGSESACSHVEFVLDDEGGGASRPLRSRSQLLSEGKYDECPLCGCRGRFA
jgi:hypothetical protein